MTEVSIYQRVQDPLVFVTQMGMAFARSQMFGCKNEHQGAMLAMSCLSENLSPVYLARKYHIIDGNLSKRADAMLAEFRERGGRHRIISRTPTEAAIELMMDGDSNEFRFTWEEAQQEPFPWSNKKDNEGRPALKKNWATERGRMQMLWARVVSDGVRAVCPEVVAGTYTPEEITDFDPSNGEVAEIEEVTDVPFEVQQAMEPAAENGPASDDDKKPEQKAGWSVAQEDPCTSRQQRDLKDLLGEVVKIDPQIKDKLLQMIAPRTKLAELSFREASELTQKLQMKLVKERLSGK